MRANPCKACLLQSLSLECLEALNLRVIQVLCMPPASWIVALCRTLTARISTRQAAERNC